MSELRGYKVPIVGMQDGISDYTFVPESEFFITYENDLLANGHFEVKLTLDKHNNMFIMNFEINGSIPTECDRCMANINLPITSLNQLIVKLEDEPSDDPDVDHIPVDSIHIDIAKYVYDFLVMSIPMVKTYDCEKENPKPCDIKALEALNINEERGDSGIWDQLKNIKVNK